MLGHHYEIQRIGFGSFYQFVEMPGAVTAKGRMNVNNTLNIAIAGLWRESARRIRRNDLLLQQAELVTPVNKRRLRQDGNQQKEKKKFFEEPHLSSETKSTETMCSLISRPS